MIRATCISICSLALLFSSTTINADVAYQSFEVLADHRLSPLEVVAWYPASGEGKTKPFGDDSPIFVATDGKSGATPDSGRYPLVLVSHGIGGNKESMSWLTAALAKRGAIAISLDHPSSTDEDMDLKKALNHRSRSKDLQATLNYLLKNEIYAKSIDPSRLYVVGFSLGGWTALSIGGLRGNLQGYAEHCDSKQATPGCAVISNHGLSLHELNPRRWDSDYKDARIVGVAAIDPLPIYGLNANDATELVKNTLLIGLGNTETQNPDADFSSSGSNLMALVSGGEQISVPAATHYSALNLCKPEAAAILAKNYAAPICSDPTGTDRQEVHRLIVDAIAKSFRL